MTEEQIAAYRKAAEEGTIPDDENPLFLFATTSTSLLVKALKREFNLVELVRLQLQERGLNAQGKWVGFKAAQKKRKSQSKGKGI